MAPTKQEIQHLHCNLRLSTEKIGKLFGCSGRSIRYQMVKYNIPRLGDSLKIGKSATWNIGLKRSKETRDKLSKSLHQGFLNGRKPHNYEKGRTRFNCEMCGKEVFDKPYRKKSTCSVECKNKLSHIYRGEKHWNFKGENAGFRQRQRNWSQYQEWRKEVLKHGDYTCIKCGEYGGRLTAHHIFTWNNYPQKRFDHENGVCLCWKCHWAFHRAFGHNNTTLEMFNQWITTPNEQPVSID